MNCLNMDFFSTGVSTRRIVISFFLLCAVLITYFVLPKNLATHCRVNEQIVPCTPPQIENNEAICVKERNGANIEVQCGIDFAAIQSEGWKILLLLAGGFATAAASWIGGEILGEKKNQAAYRPKKIRQGERKNTILMVGIGRCGKTNLIKALISDGGDEPASLTQEFDVFRYSSENEGILTRYYITDYKGQTLRQLVEHFIKAQLIPNSDLRYGDINSLVLVVDLFPWNEAESDEKQYPKINQKRVNEHLTEWSRTAIDAIFGLLTSPELKFVCLFINKVDKWKTGLGTADKEKEIQKLFESVISDLQERAQPDGPKADGAIKFEVIVGSVLRGQGVGGSETKSLRNLFAARAFSDHTGSYPAALK